MEMPEIIELPDGVWGCRLGNGTLLVGTSRDDVVCRARELCSPPAPDEEK